MHSSMKGITRRSRSKIDCVFLKCLVDGASIFNQETRTEEHSDCRLRLPLGRENYPHHYFRAVGGNNESSRSRANVCSPWIVTTALQNSLLIKFWTQC